MVGFGLVGAAEAGCFSEKGMNYAEWHWFLAPAMCFLGDFDFLALLVIEIVSTALGLWMVLLERHRFGRRG